MQYVLTNYWEFFCQENYEVDGEAAFIDAEHRAVFDDIEFLRPGLINWREWGPRARGSFVEKVDHLLTTRFAGRSEYPKHYPRVGLTVEEIRELTRSGDSLLFPRTTPEYQRFLLDMTIVGWPRGFLERDHQVIYIKDTSLVGASAGEDTNILCCDIHFDTRIAHAYPVLENQRLRGRRTYAPLTARDEEDDFV
jgi:hypothetical protein